VESCANESSTVSDDKKIVEITPPSPPQKVEIEENKIEEMVNEEFISEPEPEPEPVIVEPEKTEAPTKKNEKPKKASKSNPTSNKASTKKSKIKPSNSNEAYVMPSFPFPPPKASASHTFEENLFAKAENLYEVSELIEGALKKSGYFEKSYYKIPEGFALVTRMEKMKPDGSPAAAEERWNINHKSTGSSFDLMSYFKSLFFAKDGHYRIIVFLITPENLRQSEEKMTMDQAKQYLTKGYNRLPRSFKNIPFTQEYSCSALIYEWYKVEHEDPVFMEPSKFLGQYHLAKNKFVEYIGEE
jgi:hypothetical protein